jgi:hypothetical protein
VEDTSEDEKGNYASVGPGLGRPAPLKGVCDYSHGRHVLEEGIWR